MHMQSSLTFYDHYRCLQVVHSKMLLSFAHTAKMQTCWKQLRTEWKLMTDPNFWHGVARSTRISCYHYHLSPSHHAWLSLAPRGTDRARGRACHQRAARTQKMVQSREHMQELMEFATAIFSHNMGYGLRREHQRYVQGARCSFDAEECDMHVQLRGCWYEQVHHGFCRASKQSRSCLSKDVVGSRRRWT